MRSPTSLLLFVLPSFILLPGSIGAARAGGPLDASAKGNLLKFCGDCHGHDLAEARVNLADLLEQPDLGSGFKDWQNVIRMLDTKKMPPPDMPQPSQQQRQAMTTAINQGLANYIREHAGDPGPVVIRRMTSAELGYTLSDLTGLDLRLDAGFVSDAVGGEGFTNVGGAQFMQDSTLERHLETAKRVAAHAVIGSGPLAFYRDPGRTGLELSAIRRIQEIYREHGFRTAAGEGAVPFGLDLYPRAMFVAWQFRERDSLGLAQASLDDLAAREGLSVRFVRHVNSVIHTPTKTFPMRELIQRWETLPDPLPGADPNQAEVRAQCDVIYRWIREWQTMLSAAGGDEEEASVLTAGDVHVDGTHPFLATFVWEDDARSTPVVFAIDLATQDKSAVPVVIWREPQIQFRFEDGKRSKYQPFAEYLRPESVTRLSQGRHPAGAEIGPADFVIRGSNMLQVQLVIPPRATSARLRVTAELDGRHGDDAIVRCRIWDPEGVGATAAATSASSTLLADPDGKTFATWKPGVIEFARNFPEVSQREPAPSDRDPIPAPYDNTYNCAERNQFHYTIKYHRDDEFLVTHMLDDAARGRLDRAWADLLTSFEYHDANLRFVTRKFGLDLEEIGIADLSSPQIETLPAEPRQFVQRWRGEFQSMQQARKQAQRGHLDDAVSFASRAWRRPLREVESSRLRAFYARLRDQDGLDHDTALRALLARILVAPAFLYRAEPQIATGQSHAAAGSQAKVETVPLTQHELASRLSYFLWSSLPDTSLRAAADAGELQTRDQLAEHVHRMLRDEKARRLATEFFGQWLGFYRFDEYQGIDTGRYPEFTDRLKADLYDEAVSFFEHIVREDRPVDEILFADYVFLNGRLARHYQIDRELPDDQLARIAGVAGEHRGGLLGLGAVLTVTSAPLRTSAVKRGDWMLRRVIGTPVPPPPADVGSIPADDIQSDGLTLRQRLEAHRSDASCVNCHARIDALGFALEHYDAIGRWRDRYQDGQPIDPAGVLADGTEISGPAGLRTYLERERKQFRRTFCIKLLGYALGRTEMASDQPLIDNMMSVIEQGGRFAKVVEQVVASPQFQTQRRNP